MGDRGEEGWRGKQCECVCGTERTDGAEAKEVT